MKISGYFAHRGLHTKDQSIPENSLEAFRQARLKGYGSELDVQLSRDNTVYVFHDDTLKRLTDRNEKLSALSDEEIRTIQIFGHPIPSLKEVLEEIRGEVPLIIELKSSDNHERLCKKTMEVLNTYTGDYCVESFDPRIVYWFKKNYPEIIRGQLMMRLEDYRSRKFFGFMIMSLILSLITRPHFHALEKKMASSRFGRWYYRLFSSRLVGWTMHQEDTQDFGFYDAIIFEYYLPEGD